MISLNDGSMLQTGRLQPFPHTYIAVANGDQSGLVCISSQGLPSLATAPPPQFRGPGGIWSPEVMLTAVVADCYIFTFRAVSGAALFGWLNLECRVEGVLERVSGVELFSGFKILAKLTISPGADAAKAKRLLKKAERRCPVSNSLRGARTFECQVVTAAATT